MPQVERSWRIDRPGLRWISKAICFFGKHHWLWSKTLNAPIACAVCGHKTDRWAEYRIRARDATKRHFKP